KLAKRSHLSIQVEEAVVAAKHAGFERLNLDLLIGLHGQTLQSFLSTVERATQLEADIIEIYTMRYFDTKRSVPMTKQFMQAQHEFMSPREIMLGRMAAHIYLQERGYFACNGRTYYRPRTANDYYARFYKGNFSGEHLLGL